jgi:hypothetical protein
MRWAYSILLFLLSHLASAGPNDDLKKLLKELDDYTNEKVIPVLQIQRKKLDRTLHPNDLKTINFLRKRKDFFIKEKNKLTSGISQNPDNQMLEWEKIQTSLKEINQEANDILDEFSEVIEGLFLEIEDKMKLWRFEMNLIIDKYNAKLNENEVRLFKKHHLGEFTQPLGFLLWLPQQSDLLPDENKAGDGKD